MSRRLPPTRAAATPATSEQIARVLRSLQGIGHHQLLRALDDLDLSISQLKALFLLDQSDELTAGQLAQGLGLTPGAASRVGDSLHRLGLVSRSEDTTDRRVRRLALTHQGAALVARADQGRQEALTWLVSLLDADEREALAAALRPLAERVEALKDARQQVAAS